MGKIFPIVVIAVAIVGFSSSAYFFSESNISIENPISFETQSSNPVKEKIEDCLEQNLAGGSSVAINSFNTNMLLTLKEYAENAETEEELNDIRDKLYTMTDCKP
tara:strand:- start:2876 stop:3190 length:315 start_codon:yes stop_codon:yes gene_type:complete